MGSRVSPPGVGDFKAGYVAQVAEAADHFAALPIPPLSFSLYRRFDDQGDRLAYEDAYFHRRRRLVASALAVLSDHGSVSALEDVLWAICDEYTWALPAHLQGRSLEYLPHGEFLDLFSCETAFALAEILHLLGERLTELVRRRARAEIFRRVLVPFASKVEPWPWELMRNNWCAVCAGSIGAAALYLCEDGSELEAVLDRVYPTLDRFLESFADDGVCLEGLGYWTYGVGFFSSFADLLLRRTGGRIDLLADEKFRRIAAFQSSAYLTESLAVSFADGDAHERYRPGLSAYLGRRFPEARVPPGRLAAKFENDHCGRWCLSYRDLLWTDFAPEPTETGISGSIEFEGEGEGTRGAAAFSPRWFPDAQWLICPAAGKTATAFAAKGGHNDEPHNHNDTGSFILARGDDQLVADLGAGEYVKDYFNEKRYSIFCNSSLSHNVPIIDGCGQACGAERRARDVAFHRSAAAISLEMDLASAYEVRALRRFRRRFDYDGTGTLILTDRFEFDGPRFDIVERFVTYGRIDLSEGGAIVRGRRAALRVAAESAANLGAAVREHVHRDHAGRDVTVRSLDFRCSRDGDSSAERCPSGTSSIEFRFIFSPMDGAI